MKREFDPGTAAPDDHVTYEDIALYDQTSSGHLRNLRSWDKRHPEGPMKFIKPVVERGNIVEFLWSEAKLWSDVRNGRRPGE